MHAVLQGITVSLLVVCGAGLLLTAAALLNHEPTAQVLVAASGAGTLFTSLWVGLDLLR